MKTKILNLMSSLLLLTVMASCGKNQVSGGRQFQQNQINTLNASGELAKTNLLAWYNSSSEGGYPSLLYPVRQITRSVRTFSTSGNCSQQGLNIGGINLFNLNLCFNVSAGGTTSSTTETVTLKSSGIKSGNAKLVEALSGILNSSSGGLVLKTITQQPSQISSGSLFILQYLDSNQKSHVFFIDSGANSVINPVYSMDGAAGKEIKLISIFPNN
jgi:hypothetical protein